ncbi:outer membrane protein [Bradyrhizobium ganzhouense]|uniref:outer membrane protein n=1 Tax=Bradyrhizobium ganzhouense TaxID=1179767 RepID=UPI003CF26C8F
MGKFLNLVGGSVLAISAAVGAAQAADMPLKAKAPPPPPVASWTGWYVGLNAGGIWPNDNGIAHTAIAGPCDPAFAGCTLANASTLLANGSSFSSGFGNNVGFTGGGQLGYNWQFNGSGVAGFEADIAWTDQNRSVTFASVTPFPGFPGSSQAYAATISRHLDYIGTVRGRLGFLATPSFLLYGTGGLAYGGARSSTIETASIINCGATCAGVGGGSFSETRVGWTAGAGGEWMFAPNWSAKLEGLYYDLGRVNYATSLQQVCTSAGCALVGGIIGSTTGVTSLRFTGAIARVGVNYHFGGPVVASY